MPGGVARGAADAGTGGSPHDETIESIPIRATAGRREQARNLSIIGEYVGRGPACYVGRMQPGPLSLEQLAEQTHAELRGLADQLFRRERVSHTLQPTALIGEMWVRLLRSGQAEFDSPAAFWAWAAAAMRHILVDHARRKRAAKRTPGPHPGSQTEQDPSGGVPLLRGLDVLELHEALIRLEIVHSRSARVVEMRFFGGMTEALIADRLGVSDRTVRSDWAFARAWLYERLG